MQEEIKKAILWLIGVIGIRLDRQCDFGQYEEAWGNHKADCRRIIRITGNYIVYIDRWNNIDWETKEAFDEKRPPEEKQKSEALISHCSIYENKPIAGLSKSNILSYKTIVGEAMVNCLEGSFDAAKEILKQADEFRLDRVVEKSREWYLSYAVLISLSLISIVICLNIFELVPNESMLQKINVGTWAVAGACLSIILRSGRLQHASYAGEWLHFVESGCRIIGGFLSGQIVYLGVKSGLIFSGLVNGNDENYVIALLALLAGASERFAPSIITKIEESSSINIKE